MIESYPLYWPEGWPRTEYPERSRFDTTQHRAQNSILAELNKMNVSDIVISTNLELRRDGLPYANQSRLADPGVAVYFTRDRIQQCVPCDKWNTIASNMQAIAKTLKALRGLERWGAKDMVDAAFRGFKALPESIIATETPWWIILGLDEHPKPAPEQIKEQYKRLAKIHHPDVGGDPKEFERIKRAYEEGMSKQ